MRRAVGRRLAAGAAAFLALLGACTFSTDRTVKPHLLLKPLPAGLVNSFNLEDKLKRGYVPEILRFFAEGGGKTIDSTRASRILGQCLLERGEFAEGSRHLELALGREARPGERAELAWQLSQSAYFLNRFGEAARWGDRARAEGRQVPLGWIAFLDALAHETLYGGAAPGARFSESFRFGRPDLIRVTARVNGVKQDELVLDSGASLSLLTESAAARLGVTKIPDAVASAIGLHNTEFPLHFGLAKTLEVGGVTLTNVPFGILADAFLTFQRNNDVKFECPGVLGVHLLKEFDWAIHYRDRRLQAVRLDLSPRRGSKDQNLFFRRLKPMVRASFNQEPWFLFLLDTGAEPTMVTRSGLRHSRTAEVEGAYPMTLEGIGNSQVSWGKTSNVTVGLDRFMVHFKDMVIKEEDEGIADGVIGSSFLSNFDAELRFSTMTLRVDLPRIPGAAPGASEPSRPGIGLP